MSRLVRITLMWLLAFAVPAQGYAAATMFNCGPAHHGAAEQVVHAGHSPDHAEHAAHHSHADESALAATDGADADVAKPQAGHKASKVSCSACASCCTGAALPTSVLSFDATPIHDAVVALVPRSVAAFLTDGPERPPRSFLV